MRRYLFIHIKQASVHPQPIRNIANPVFDFPPTACSATKWGFFFFLLPAHSRLCLCQAFNLNSNIMSEALMWNFKI